MTESDTIDLMNAAGTEAGDPDDGWNRRYVAALNGRGLYLSWWPVDSVPEDAIMVPLPYAEGWQYQYPSYVTTE